MKIVLPYSAHKGFDVNSTKMVGGIEKFIKEVKEMGGIISIAEGDAEVDKAKDIDFSKFNERYKS